MFVCVLYVCYVVIRSVRWFRNYEIQLLDLCFPNPTLYYSIGSLLCTNLTVCSDCIFACVLYVCLCIACLLVCCMFAMLVIGSVLSSETYEMRRLDLCSPNPTLYYSIGSLLCKNLTVCSDCMYACVLYVCLCVVECLLCGDWVCTVFRNYEMRRLDLCSPNPTLYYSIGSLLCTNLALCDDCMFACVLYVCLCIVCLLVYCMFAM